MACATLPTARAEKSKGTYPIRHGGAGPAAGPDARARRAGPRSRGGSGTPGPRAPARVPPRRAVAWPRCAGRGGPGLAGCTGGVGMPPPSGRRPPAAAAGTETAVTAARRWESVAGGRVAPRAAARAFVCPLLPAPPSHHGQGRWARARRCWTWWRCSRAARASWTWPAWSRDGRRIRPAEQLQHWSQVDEPGLGWAGTGR
jgi:hypothetical protein